MQFLRYLLLALIAFIAALFTYGNWTRVEVKLWSDLVAEVNLPFLLLMTFLAGLVPMLFVHLTQRWRLKQRLQTTERTLEALRVSMPAEPVATEPLPQP